MGGFDLQHYIRSQFTNVERGPEDMRPYQPTAVQFLLDNPYSALFIDVGLGKSVISLTAILHLLLNDAEIDPWLVVAPKRVANDTWPTEIGLWRHTAPLTYKHIREDEIVDAVNAAGRAEREVIKAEWKAQWEGEYRLWSCTDAEIREFMREDMRSVANRQRIEKARRVAARKALREDFEKNRATIHIISRDHIEFLVEAWGRHWPYKGVIIDESDSLKDHTTGRFKALRRVRPLIKRLHELTATPAAETYMHLFAQIFLLDEGKRFGHHITKFQQRYFTQNIYTRKWTLRPGAEEEISEKIADICLVMKAEDYLDLEKPVPLKDVVKMTSEQAALYKQMETDYLVTLPSGVEIEAETAAELSQKLLQMASGVLYETVLEDDGKGGFKKRRVVHHLHDHKIEKLQTLVEEVRGERLIVAYWHQSSLDRLKKAFPKAVVMDDDGKCIKDWNKGKIPMLLIHPASAAHGLNLQHGGRRIVFFDIPWSLTLYLQLIGRLAGARQLARPEDQRVVFLHHLITEGTLDEAVIEALGEKRDAQEVLFRLLRLFRRKLKPSGGRSHTKCLLVLDNNAEL